MVLSSPPTDQPDSFLSANTYTEKFTSFFLHNTKNVPLRMNNDLTHEVLKTAQAICYCSSLQIAILLTGGRQSPDGGSLEDAVQLMRNRDVTTYVISIGDRSDVPVQRPEDLFYLTSYSDLPRQVQSIAKNITKPRGIQATKA